MPARRSRAPAPAAAAPPAAAAEAAAAAAPPAAAGAAKRARRPRGIAKPPRARSAYSFFMAEHRGAGGGDAAEAPSLAERSRAAAAAWRALPDRSKYEALAAESRAAAAAARAAAPAGGEDGAPPAKKRKRPPSAFQLFATEERARLRAAEPELAFGEATRRCAAAWKALADRAPFEARAAEARAAHEAALPPKRPKRAPTAFIRFSAEERKRLRAAEPELAFGEVARRCAAAWKALDDEARRAWAPPPAAEGGAATTA